MIVDGTPDARKRLSRLLDDTGEYAVIGSYGNGEEALEALEIEEVDVLFLDIRMPGLSGLELVGSLDPTTAPQVVFVTAQMEHAIEAFDLGALDYVLKPLDEKRIALSLDRVSRRVRAEASWATYQKAHALLSTLVDVDLGGRSGRDRPPTSRAPTQRIPVRTGKRVEFVDVDDLDWIEAENYYAWLHVGSRSYLHRETLSKFEALLDPTEFVRVHRSAIVRLSRVKEFRTHEPGHHEVFLQDGTRVRVSRTRRARVLRALGVAEGVVL